MLHYDLHCHSTWSDGVLAPADVVARAAARGVDVLALTDHDETGGLEEAHRAAKQAGIRLVNGTELSVTWEEHTIHVVGLGIDPGNAVLAAGLNGIRQGRRERAGRMAHALAQAGIPGALDGALKYVTHEGLVSRTHFARFLVESGHVKEVKDVFKRYLTPGKPGYVPHRWVGLAEGIEWIHAAGGQAVLAHPGRYSVGRVGLRRLLDHFRAAGGDALEVLSSSHTPAQWAEFTTLARVWGLLASTGSDYHAPKESWIDLGDLPPLPAGTVPVWQHW